MLRALLPITLFVFGALAFGACCEMPTVGELGLTNQAPGPLTRPTLDVQLLAISDWHGQVDPGPDVDGTADYFGGAAFLSQFFKEDRARNPNTLLFTAGDSFGATPPLVSLFEERPAIEVLNYLGLTADTFGNHNFDFGLDFLKARVSESTYQWVSTNLNIEEGLGPLPNVVKGFHVFEVGPTEPKVKVGVVGLTALNFAELLAVGRTGPVKASEPVSAANNAAAAARAAGAHVVVALAHMGATGRDSEGKPTGQLIDVAKGLRGVDVLLGDHTDVIVNTTFGDVLVVENRSRGRTYGRVTVKVVDGLVQSKNAEIIDANVIETATLPTTPCTNGTECASGFCDQDKNTCIVSCPTTPCSGDFTCQAGSCRRPRPKDEDIEGAVIKKYRDQLAQKLDTTTGTTTYRFERNEIIERNGETPIGDLVVDAMLAKYKPDGAQIALINTGAIRSPLPSFYAPADLNLRRPLAGYRTGPPFDLVVGDAHTILPLSNRCVVRSLTGEILWQMLENAVIELPRTHGRFLAVAGMKYSYQLSGAPGARVRSVTLDDGTPGGKVITSTDKTDYKVVIIDYLNSGGDNYLMLTSGTAPELDGLAEVVAEYMKAQGTVVPAPGSYDPADTSGTTPCVPTSCPRITRIP
jgi:2',3'-cyclic-nucleotide 2'-phosphodiesterase (5'-nucleotidase family)